MTTKRERAKTSPFGAIEREILENLSAGDLLIGFLMSGRSTRRMYKIARVRAKHRYHTRLAIERLAEQGFIRTIGGRTFITISGAAAIDTTIKKTRDSLMTQKWDRKWRIVSYDIPEQYKHLRDTVRLILKRAGFAKLHHSVWIFPHGCEELTSLLQRETRLRKYILYGVLEKIGNERRLKALFSLA